MTLTGAPDTDRPDAAGVVELSVSERVRIADRVWQADFAERDPVVRRELAGRAHTAAAAADCTFLGVVGPDGIEASADLFVRGDTAQVEEVSRRPRAGTAGSDDSVGSAGSRQHA